MSTKLPNAPVYYAIAQAQFNPVPAMGKYVDEIQDVLRRKGFTLFEPHQFTQLQMPAEPGNAVGEPQVSHAVSWFITNESRSAGYILGPNSLAFHTTHYETSEEFLPSLIAGLRAVHDVVSLAHISRLGLRYLDAVLPKPGETVEDYLDPGLHGIRFSSKQQHAMAESSYITDTGPMVNNGNLISRVWRVTAPLGFPADLIPQGLNMMPRFVTDPLNHACIDTDHSVSGQMPVHFDALEEQLKSLHRSIKAVFAANVTEHANAVWARNP